MNCERCGGVLSMSATSGGTTWWRCTACQHVQGFPAAPPLPAAPALAPNANRARYASGGEPAYGGGLAPSPPQPRPAPATIGANPTAQTGTFAETIHPLAPNGPPATVVGASAEPNGCGVCGSDDVQYVLETDVGVDAATLASGQVIRAAFCSIDCLAEKLGLARPEPTV